MKGPLILALVVVIVRIVLELAGASDKICNVFGLAWLYFLVPIYFGLQISGSGTASPYMALLKTNLLFAFYTRLMVLVSYQLAYLLDWTAPRFQLNQGGVVGASTLQGLLVIPVRNLVIWVVAATLVGMIIGSIVLAIRLRGVTKAAAYKRSVSRRRRGGMKTRRARIERNGVVALKSDPSVQGRVLDLKAGGRFVRVQFPDRPRPTLHSLAGLIVLLPSAQLRLF